MYEKHYKQLVRVLSLFSKKRLKAKTFSILHKIDRLRNKEINTKDNFVSQNTMPEHNVTA